MIKKIILLLLLTTSIVLAGCGGGDTPTGPNYDPFIGGTEGLVFEFVPGMPPDQEGAILDKGMSKFAIGMKVTNAGEDDLDVNELRIDLVGILPDQFDITWPETTLVLQDPLAGAKKSFDGSVLKGEFTTLVYDGLSYLPDTRGDSVKSLRLDTCYTYQTMSTTPVCIANDVTGSLVDSENAVCQISNEQTPSYNSAAPVQIKSFRQYPQGGNHVTIMFDVVHTGTGDIYAPGNSGTAGPSNCDSSTFNADKNKVWLEMYLPDESSSSVDLSCMGTTFSSPNAATVSTPVEGELTLFAGEPRTVTCTINELTTNQDVIYEDLLSIDLHYNYGQKFLKDIVIKDVGSTD